MAIRKDGIVISDDINEKLVNMTFTNETNQKHSIEEIYLAKLIYDNGLTFRDLKSSHVFDMSSKSVKHVNKHDDKKIYILNNGLESEIDLEKAFVLPNWNELREYLKIKGFKMEFHYDPFKDGHIKIGFMKPKFLTGTDNFIIESHGKTDLEALYKVLLELVKYENNLS